MKNKYFLTLVAAFGVMITQAQASTGGRLTCRPAYTDTLSFTAYERGTTKLVVEAPFIPKKKISFLNAKVDHKVSETAEGTVYMGAQNGVLVTMIMPEPIPAGGSSEATVYITVDGYIVQAAVVCKKQ